MKLAYFFFIFIKINNNGIKLWKEQHLLDDEVANEKYEVILRLQQRNEEIQSCSLQNTEHEGHLQEKKWWNVMYKNTELKNKDDNVNNIEKTCKLNRRAI